MDNKGVIIINQTLHGYYNGHSLLAASLELVSEVKRVMMPISDMSGNNMIDGFEEYITGYPIKEINSYAVAKTWYAPEMKRPGCVWTHTLLFSFADLPRISDIHNLLSLFRRPLGDDDIGYYSFPLTWIDPFRDDFVYDHVINDNKTYVFSPDLTKVIIKCLYSNSNEAIFIKGVESYGYESLILSLWMQQWPRLKRNFSFCTGAISPRSFGSKLLDLQVVPFRIDSTYSNEGLNTTVDFRSIDDYKKVEWVEKSYFDLLYPTDLRKYLRLFGADIQARRISFKLLVEAFVFFEEIRYSDLQEELKLDHCINYLSQMFPSEKEANNLKAAVLDSLNNKLSYLLPLFGEREILFALSTTQCYPSFDINKLRYRDRFFDFFNNNLEEGVYLLNSIVENGPNSNGEDVIKVIANSLDNSSLYGQILSFRNLVLVLISLNPSLTYSKAFWLNPLNNHVEIIHNLQRVSPEVDWQIIISILIETGSPIDLSIFDIGGLNIERYILNWLRGEKQIGLGLNWCSYLRKKPAGILSWLKEDTLQSSSVLKAVIPLLNPNSKVVIDSGLYPWIDIVSYADSKFDYNSSLKLKSFCLALAFNLQGYYAKLLFEKSFELVYNGIANGELEYQYWSYLEVHTRPLSIFQNWDRCKKLINALVDHSIDNAWPINEVIYAIRSPELRSRIQIQYKR